MKTFKDFMNEDIKGQKDTFYINIVNSHGSWRMDWPTQDSPMTGEIITYSANNLIDPGGKHPASVLPGESALLSAKKLIWVIKQEKFKKLVIDFRSNNKETIYKKVSEVLNKVRTKTGISITVMQNKKVKIIEKASW